LIRAAYRSRCRTTAPTAAALLDTDLNAGRRFLTNPPAFPASGEYVGLDARQALPPLLKPDLL
jgi:hypothetical protein